MENEAVAFPVLHSIFNILHFFKINQPQSYALALHFSSGSTLCVES